VLLARQKFLQYLTGSWAVQQTGSSCQKRP
jgi:hypothetical protein